MLASLTKQAVTLSHRGVRKYVFSTQANTTAATEAVDVLIVGGGVVGTSLAVALQQQSSLRVRVIEAGSPKPFIPLSPVPHPRSYALSPSSLEFLQLETHDLTSTTKSLGYYKHMQVWEAQQPAFLHFGIEDLPSPSSSSHLGAVVEDTYLVQELSSRLLPDTIVYDTTVSQLDVPKHMSNGLVQVELLHHNQQEATKTRTMECQLVVAADGGNSQIRKMLGIGSRVYEYGETALTFTVEVKDSMHQRAFQRFLKDDGILALLPTRSDHHAIVVWSTTPEQVSYWKQAPSTQLMDHLNQMLQQGPERLKPLFTTTPLNAYGSSSSSPFDLSSIVSNVQYGVEKVWETVQYGSTLAGMRNGSSSSSNFVTPPLLHKTASILFTFPLQLRQVSRYTVPRVALVGDAAHTVHPMAGQGLNLGIQDVQCIMEHIMKAYESGMDIATFVEDGYETSRQQQVRTTVQGIHALHEMFQNQNTIVQHLKTVGMNVVQNVAPIRSLLVQAACGGVGVGKNDKDN